MDPNTFVNALFLCLVNVAFMVAGIILNAVVIISLLRSSQIRKKLCYFMILILSCFDMAAVAIIHPVLILSTILWSMEISHVEIYYTRIYTNIILGVFSMFALLTLTIERFLALTYPFLHQTGVTKRRLVLFQVFLMITTASLQPVLYFHTKTGYMLIIMFVSFLLIMFICLNYKMFIIAKSKRENGRVAATRAATSSHRYPERKSAF